MTTIAVRSVGWLRRHGYLRAEEAPPGSADAESPWMRCLQGSLGVGELQRWAEHGGAAKPADRARGSARPKPTRGLGAQHLGFNLHAGVSVPGGLPAARERLLHYCARPPLALDRLSLLDDGRICYRIKDGDQVRLMTPTQFLARLSALVPPPRHPLVRFYGVWAPHHRWRSSVVVAIPEAKRATGCEPSGPLAAPAATGGTTLAPNETATAGAVSTPPETARASSKPRPPSAAELHRATAVHPEPALAASDELRFTRLSRLAWSILYQRIFDIDPLECSSCGGRMRFVEVIEDVGQARSELRRRHLPAEPPPLARARAPDWHE